MLKSYCSIFLNVIFLFLTGVSFGQIEEVDPPNDIKTITFGSQKESSIAYH